MKRHSLPVAATLAATAAVPLTARGDANDKSGADAAEAGHLPL
ncbi:hypothetical protein ACIOKD_17125 [Streptomyces sp. NPDC087844]